MHIDYEIALIVLTERPRVILYNSYNINYVFLYQTLNFGTRKAFQIWWDTMSHVNALTNALGESNLIGTFNILHIYHLRA